MIELSINWGDVARIALLSRELDLFEEKHLAPQGKVKYQFSAKGHELSQVLLAQALDHSHDAVTVYYRSRPLLLACGLEPATALAADMALSNTPSQGRDTGVVYNLPGQVGLSVLPASGNVGAQFSPAAGWAQAILYHQQVLEEDDWKGAIAVAHGGDGSTASNGFWAALNIATTQHLPMLFFIEDNCYSLSVPADLQTPGGNIATNLASFQGLKVIDSNGSDPAAAWDSVSTAIDYVRRGEGACLPFGKSNQLLKGDQLTIISWGETVHRCLAASLDFPDRVTVLDLRTIIPWDKETVLESVRKTGKALIVHEDTLTSGFGAEISAVISAEAFTDLDAPVQRMATPDIPVPYNVTMMESILPTVEKIKVKIQEMLAF